MAEILKCKKCNNYTMKELCTTCDQPTEHTRPPRYQPGFKHKHLRLEARREELEEKYLH